MATKRTAQPNKATQNSLTEEQLLRRATRQDELDAGVWLAENTNIVPCFYGPTSVGKTYKMRELAQQRGAHFEVILLSTDTPDEVMGFQTIGKDGQLHAQPPYWFRRSAAYLDENPDGEVILFFDEVGQAAQEVRAAVYTFFRDRVLRGMKLEGKVMVFAATNAAEFSGAWRSRLCLIHFPASAEYLDHIAKGHELAEFVAKGAGSRIATTGGDSELDNSPPPEPSTVHAGAIDLVRRIGASFYRLTKEAQSFIVSGILPQTDCERLLRKLNESMSIDADALAREPDLLAQTLGRFDRPRAVNLAVSVLVAVPALDNDDQRIRALDAILTPFMADADKLQDYYEAGKSQQTIEGICKIDPKKFETFLKDNSRLFMEDGQMKGQWVDSLLAQVEEEESSKEAA